MKKREVFSILFLGLSLITLLIINGCNDQSGEDVTGGVIDDLTVEQVSDSSGDSGSDDDSLIACNKDSDCGQETFGEPSCFQGNAFVKKTIYSCVFPGTPQAYCNAVKKETMIGCDTSRETCREGVCVAFDDLPCMENDGGIKPAIPGKVIDSAGKEVPDECISQTRLMESYCADGKGRAKTQVFDCDYQCSQAECITKDEKYNLN